MNLLIDDLWKNQKIDGQNLSIPGYFICSTSPINIEDDELEIDQALPTISDVIEHLYQNSKSEAKEPGLIIQIHGYNTGVKKNKPDYIRESWKQICKYLNQKDKAIKDKKNSFVYVGYRWPSESVPSNLYYSIKSLPVLLKGLLYGSIVITVSSILSLIKFSSPWFTSLIIVGVFTVAVVATLFILRTIVYFRDTYRANNFAVPDLLEFIRQLDQGLIQRTTQDLENADDRTVKAQDYWNKRKIKLTFIGHSMGGFVTTQVVKILSDVFDPRSIGNVDSLDKNPSANIGRVFCLGRLILVSPDIPVNTILSGRTNFLRSSLRRFEEAYLFSNEGDLVLRLASTAANYFSFPASSRTQGYRLGNVTVNLLGKKVYGIVNLEKLFSSKKLEHLLQYIGVKVLNKRENKGLLDNRKYSESLVPKQKDPESIADLFTYFDCTEYQDQTDYQGRQGKSINVLICHGQKSPLNLWQYIKLLKAYIDFSGNSSKGIDIHGGYFYGHFSKLIIYRLAFLGFQGLLDSLILEPPSQFNLQVPPPLQEKLNRSEELDLVEKRKTSLEYFSFICKQKFIQIAASSERYRIDVLNEHREEVRRQILSPEKKGN